MPSLRYRDRRRLQQGRRQRERALVVERQRANARYDHAWLNPREILVRTEAARHGWESSRRGPGFWSGRVVNDMLFLVTSLPVGLAGTLVFWIGMTVLLVGAGIWIGIQVVVIPFAILLALGQVERARLRVFLHLDVAPSIDWDDDAPNIWARGWRVIRNPQIWRDVLYLNLLLVVGAIEAGVVLWPFGLILSPLAVIAGVPVSPFPLLWGTIESLTQATVASLIGLACLVPTVVLAHVVARLHGQLAVVLLGQPNEEIMVRRVEELRKSRTAVMRAMHVERRRIERDLHDGAQQQLVTLAMELGRAREKYETDPIAACQIVRESRARTLKVVEEMRGLVQGVHPGILTDQGLAAAIPAIASRCPIPVRLLLSFSGRLDDGIESTAYFAVTEALTNAARYSQATEIQVQLARERNRLVVVVVDNGIGGADMYRGTGLRGLQDRVAAFEGRLSWSSPPGGGTRIEVSLPLIPPAG